MSKETSLKRAILANSSQGGFASRNAEPSIPEARLLSAGCDTLYWSAKSTLGEAFDALRAKREAADPRFGCRAVRDDPIRQDAVSRSGIPQGHRAAGQGLRPAANVERPRGTGHSDRGSGQFRVPPSPGYPIVC